MRRLFVCIFSLVWVVGMMAQANVSKPYWVKKVPKAPRSAMYYYRMTMAEAKTYDEAYAKAFAIAIHESRWKLGVTVDLNTSEQTILENVINDISLQTSQVRLPINKVCEYSENSSVNMNIRVYVLWQVARYGNVDPEFDDLDRCE